MGKWLIACLLLVAAALAAAWWWLYRPQEQHLLAARTEVSRLQSDAGRRDQQVQSLEGQVADLQSLRLELQRSSTELQQKVAEKEAELNALRGTQDELVSGLKAEIESRQVQVQRYQDQLRVEMVDEVLFDSGEADLKPAGKTIIEKVGKILDKAEGRRIEVQGHTDNIPIQGALAKRYASNWELSSARAVNVVRFLQQSGVDPARLMATARSEYQPREANDTDEGRRKNRRIEILLGPRVVASTTAASTQ